MPTQRLTIATIAGESAAVIRRLFGSWHALAEPSLVDQFCGRLRENGMSLPVVYFCEWVDHWLMGDQVSRPNAISGQVYQVTCLSPDEARGWADNCGDQYAEQGWLAARLREAAEGWGTITDEYIVVLVREVLGGSTLDEEVMESLRRVPAWLRNDYNDK